ncbi:MAG: DnaA/Hda family protein [bacterium]|jgi:chromosomal replication initiator protein|nr:MAG: hypothetical protein DIU52_09475 [bacterium]
MAWLELDPRFTFEAFVIGAANRLAAAAARRVAESPGASYNPLFIYSASGLGKTHLINAIGHHARRLHPHINVVYDSLEHFTSEITAAIEAGERDAFRQRVSGTGILLLDDVQFLAGQRRMQEELLRVWDALSSRGGQVVLASDRPPPEIDGLDDRLQSRFSGGLIVDIGPPDYETRVAIVRRKAEERGQVLGPGVAEALARIPFTNVRELQGALNRVIAVQELEGRTVTPEEVARLLGAGSAGVPAPQSDLPDFLTDLAAAPAAHSLESAVERRLTEAIRRWEAEGYRTRRLEGARRRAAAGEDVEPIIHGYEADVERLREIVAEISSLDPAAPELQEYEVLRDPDRIADAEELLAQVRERTRPLPAPPPGLTFADLALAPDLFAVRAAAAVLEAPGKRYNPLFVYGPQGAGKSLLLATLGSELKARYPEMRVVYVDARAFAGDLIEALEHNRVESWRGSYRRAHALLIDGVDALAETERAQEELFHLFDALHRSGAQLAFAARQHPARIAGLQERLKTRLESGLVVELPPPPVEGFTLVDWDAELGWGGAPAGAASPIQPTGRHKDEWFLSREKVVWDWPYAADWVVEELE